MIALAARFFPHVSAKAIAEFETVVSVALFCGVGLLISVTVLVLDKYIPGDWVLTADPEATAHRASMSDLLAPYRNPNRRDG